MFRGLYINLDRDAARRKHMELEFERFGLSGRYQRLPAVANSWGALGCLKSHLKALDLARRQHLNVHILEDDTILSPGLGPFLDSPGLEDLLQSHDIIFLDMWVDPKGPVVRRFQAALQQPGPMDLKGIRIGTAASYVVSPRSAGRLLELLKNVPPPVDSRYGDFLKAGVINAAVMVPFLTCVDMVVGAGSAIQSISIQEKQRYLMLRSAFFADTRRQPAFKILSSDGDRPVFARP
jgi:GR25 family glycosyltransferase involved in LPS biosynthesis